MTSQKHVSPTAERIRSQRRVLLVLLSLLGLLLGVALLLPFLVPFPVLGAALWICATVAALLVLVATRSIVLLLRLNRRPEAAPLARKEPETIDFDRPWKTSGDR